MRADGVEISWAPEQKKWVVRIRVGEEVIRRNYDVPRNALEPAIPTAAQEAIKNEGYEPDVTQITIHR